MDHKKIIQAHKHSISNRETIRRSTLCGCFYCLKIFSPTEIKEWIPDEGGQTALCPSCGIDSIIGESSDYAITECFLEEMRKEWFT